MDSASESHTEDQTTTRDADVSGCTFVQSTSLCLYASFDPLSLILQYIYLLDHPMP